VNGFGSAIGQIVQRSGDGHLRPRRGLLGGPSIGDADHSSDEAAQNRRLTGHTDRAAQ
jgi:hypothetical protein